MLFISWGFFLFSLFCFIIGFYLLNYNFFIFFFSFPIMSIMDLNISFCFDFISLIFFSVVCIISSVVFIYSYYYMDMQWKVSFLHSRFLMLFFLFVLSMFFLVFSFSWFLVMLGWDGLGIVSFLLVIYYNDSKSMNSGLITVLTNRIGDCFFIMGFIFMFYCSIFSFSFFDFMMSKIFLWVFIIGCVTKSAQFPFSSWLPEAMAAPTPVSSLVHSSTLVTAGVYLLIRFNYFFFNSYLLIILSILTMFLGGLFAIFEKDFKKIVAMSTLSQLGFMIFSLSMGGWVLSLIHVIFHAFFKSSLFMSTGNLMHFVYSTQDSRIFSNFFISYFSKIYFIMSCLSLMGFPFFLGFYSKDYILSLFSFNIWGLMVFLFFCSCCFTVSYSMRLLSLGFLKFSRFFSTVEFKESWVFFSPLLILFVCNVFLGSLFNYYFFDSNNYSFLDFFIGLMIIVFSYFFFLLF